MKLKNASEDDVHIHYINGRRAYLVQMHAAASQVTVLASHTQDQMASWSYITSLILSSCWESTLSELTVIFKFSKVHAPTTVCLLRKVHVMH